MHRLPKNMLVPSLRADRFSNLNIKILGPAVLFLNFKKIEISSQIQQKRPSHAPAMASFTYMYPPRSKNCFY